MVTFLFVAVKSRRRLQGLAPGNKICLNASTTGMGYFWPGSFADNQEDQGDEQ